MKKYLTTILLLIALVILIPISGVLNIFNSTVHAVGDLTIDFGVPSDTPMFVINNFAPGQTQTKSFIVTNGASSNRPVGVKGIKTSEIANLSQALEITISSAGTDLYGGTLGNKTLAQFFSDSQSINGILLATQTPSQTKTYSVLVKFKEDSGNEFQNSSVVFNLEVGIVVEVPNECLSINFSGSPIFGTSGNNTLNGTTGNDLIFGFEGNDRINGSGGNDCIVGGLGQDSINGGNGNDKLFGNEDRDDLDGSNGEDLLVGGDNNDTLRGSNGIDLLLGGTGDDQLFGDNGDDNLNGEDGIDKATGGLGKDTCVAETKFTCEL